MTTRENIARLRRKKEWTQARLAQAAGLSRSWIAAVEQGRGCPSVSALAVIADALGVRMEDLKGD